MRKIENNIRLLTFFNFFLDFRLFAPIAIVFFANVTGSFALGMSIFSIVMVTQTIFELPMGVVSDFIGRKKTLILGSIFSLCAVSSYTAGSNFGYVALMVGAICEGLSRTFFSGNNSALLYETLQEAKRESEYAEISGKTDSMFQLALAISALGGALLALYYPLTVLFWISIIPQVITVVMSYFIIEPHVHSEKIQNNIFTHVSEALKGFLENRKLRLLASSDAIGYGIGEAMHEFRPAFISFVWPSWAAGVFRGLTHIFGFIGFRYAGSFIKRFTAVGSLFMIGTFASSLHLISLTMANLLSPLLMSITSLGYGIDRTASETLKQKEFTEKQRATMGSLGAMMGSLMFAVVAVFFGWFADKYGIIPALFLGQILSLYPLYLNYRLYRDHA